MTEERPAEGGRGGGAAGWRTGLVLTGVLLAFWPVLVWWWRRTGDDSDEPLGVLALASALGFVWRDRGTARVTAGALTAGLAVVIGARLGEGRAPMLVIGLGMVAALVLSLRLWVLPGVVMLLSLALPWVATLQFVTGYPLRVVVAAGAEKVLRALGTAVTREGTDLWHEGVAVGVDAPCSGIRMLWFLLFAAAFLAARFGLGWARTLGLMAAAGGLALAANGVRATVLFFPEAGLVEWPEWTHEGTGVALFAPCLACLMWLARRWQKRRVAAEAVLAAGSVSARWPGVFATGCAVVAASWGLRTEAPGVKPEQTDGAWPGQFRGMRLEPLALSVREEHFAAGFPGGLARFRCGEGEVIFRRVNRATRMLHPAEDCFRAAGFEMQRLSGEAAPGDGLWKAWRARRGEERPLVVCEQIRSRTGELFTDVSAWYWSALRHPEDGPWLAVTWVRHAEPEADGERRAGQR